ncbi:MAG: O-antigen ligase family protein [Pseudomonadales bacterium]
MNEFLGDRIQINSLLIVLSFVSVLALSSQSAASWPTYLLGVAVAVNYRSWDDVFRVRYFWLILGLVAYLVASSLWSQPATLEGGLRVFGRALLIVLFVVACAECQLRGQLKRWLGRSLAIVATLAAGAAIYVHFVMPNHFPGERLHGLGQLDNPIIAGMVYGAALIIMLDLLNFERNSWWRIIGAVCVLVLVSAIYLTGSRSAWMSITGGVAIYLVALRVRDRQQFTTTVVSLGVIFGILLLTLVAGDSIRELILPRGVSYRPDIWQETLNRIVGEGGMMLGLGIGTPDRVVVDGVEFSHPHSLYLSVLFQGGVIGLSLLFSLIMFTISNLLRSYDERDAKLALGLFGVALLGYVLDGHELIDKVSDMWFLFWFPVALALGLAWRLPGKVPDDT